LLCDRRLEDDHALNVGALGFRRIFRLLDMNDFRLLDVAADANRFFWRRRRRHAAGPAKHSTKKSAIDAAGNTTGNTSARRWGHLLAAPRPQFPRCLWEWRRAPSFLVFRAFRRARAVQPPPAFQPLRSARRHDDAFPAQDLVVLEAAAEEAPCITL
jgi:hypothetical protein